MAIKLIGFDELTEKIYKVELTTAEAQSMDCDEVTCSDFSHHRDLEFSLGW